MQARAVAAVRRHDAAIEAEHGPGAVWVAVSHGDIIKSVLADALGMHLDLFQRINVDPASVSIVRYTGTRPYVLATNTHAGDLSWLVPAARRRRPRRRRTTAAADDAAVGGGAGPSAAVIGWSDMPDRPRLRPAGALRHRHRRRARRPHVLPPGPHRRPGHQRRAGEAAGRRARRAHRRAARRGDGHARPPTRRPGRRAARARGRRTRSSSRSRRSSAPAP